MFRATRRILQAVPSNTQTPSTSSSLRTKISTGISGYPVHPEPIKQLSETYSATLQLLQQVPSSAVYRQSTESITQERFNHVKQFSTGEANEQEIEQLERQIGAGVIEEVIEQAQGEFQLVAKMIEWKAWEDLEVAAAPGQWEQFKQTPSTTTADDLHPN